MQITGTITFVEVEGGFWGILGDQGVPFHPVNGIPKDFQEESLRVSAEVKPYSGVSNFMWGRLVELVSIKRLNK